MQTARRSPLVLAAILAAVVAAALLRWALSDYSLWFDEFASLVFADRPLSQLWSGWMVRETNPPLFYTILHGWTGMAGTSLATLRLLPIALGALGILLLAAIAYRAHGPRSAVAAVVLAGLSAHHVYYSHTLRAYILAFDGVALSLLGLVILVADGPRARWRGAALYALGAVVAIHSHTTLFLWPVMAMLGFAVAQPRDMLRWGEGPVRALLLANLAIAVASAWWLAMTLAQLRVSSANIDWIPPLDLPQSLTLIVHSAFLARGEAGWAGSLAWLLVWLTVVGAAATRRDPATRLIAAIGLAALVLLCGAEMYRPILLERTVFWLSIFPVLLVAGWLGGSGRQGWRLATGGALACALALNLAEASQGFESQDWMPSLQRIAREPGGVLVVEHEAMGVVAQAACRATFPERACPFPVVAMRSASQGNVWARGLYDDPLVAPETLSHVFASDARIFALRQGDMDIVSTMGALGAPVRPKQNREWPEGPYAADDFVLIGATR